MRISTWPLRWLAEQYIPGVNEAENLQTGQDALDEFQKVLDLDPKSLVSVKGIASLDFNMKRFAAATQFYVKAIELEPNNPELYYAMGIADWAQSYTDRLKLRENLGLAQGKPLMDAGECWDFRNKIQARVNDGIDRLAKALQLRPDYDDAMAYNNLMYRERAEIQCGDIVSYTANLKRADEWVDATLAVKKEKAGTEPVNARSSDPR